MSIDIDKNSVDSGAVFVVAGIKEVDEFAGEKILSDENLFLAELFFDVFEMMFRSELEKVFVDDFQVLEVQKREYGPSFEESEI